MQIKKLLKFKNDDFTTTKFIIFVILAPFLLILFDFLIGFIFNRFLKQFTVIQAKLFGYFLYLSLGLWLSSEFYKFIYIHRKKLALAVVIAIINLVILRYLIVVNFFNRILVSFAIINTLREVAIILFSLSIFTTIFKKTENIINIYGVNDVRYDVEDPKTKFKHDMGICSKCGWQTKITNVRLIPFMGKGDRYFCDNCGVFVRGNPLQSALLGITYAIVSSYLIINQFLVISDGVNTMTTVQLFLFLIFLYGIFEGCKMSFAGIKGLIRSRKMFEKKEKVANNIQAKVDYQELGRNKKFKRIIAREGLVIIAILAIGLFTFNIGKQWLKHYKNRYWEESIVKDERYLSVGPIEQKEIKKQYNDLLFIGFNGRINKEYGLGSYIAYCLQFIGFWLFRLGYPIYLIIHFIVWALRTLRER